MLSITVDTLVDESDGNYGPGDLSLREAISLAANTAGDDTINFAPDLTGTIELNSAITFGSGAHPIHGDITIEGPGADRLTLDANGATHVVSFQYNPLAYDLTISGLKLTGASSAAIYRYYEGNNMSIALDQVEVTDNGAGVSVSVGGPLTVSNSTIAENDGLGVYVMYASAKIVNTTVSGNETTGSVAGLSFNSSTATLTNVTVANNRADKNNTSGNSTAVGGIVGPSSVTMHNSIVADNFAGADDGNDVHRDLGGPFAAASSYNLIGFDSNLNNNINDDPSGTGNHNQVGGENGAPAIDPELTLLGDFGGPTRTHALIVGSPAVDAGSDDLAVDASGMPLSSDQRGHNRPMDIPTVPNSGDNTTDIGAFEAGNPTTLSVNTLDDDDGGIWPPDIDTAHLTLREALRMAAALHGDHEIVFDDALFTGGPPTLTLSTTDLGYPTPGPLVIASNVVIANPRDILVTVDGADETTVFEVSSRATATIQGLRITGGSANDGAGIYSSGALTVDRCEIEGNTSQHSGGGIHAASGTLTVTNCTIANNSATWYGGGITAASSSSTVSIINSTISANTALATGGVYDASSGAQVINSTITANVSTAGLGGGVHSNYGTTKLYNTIVAGNFGGTTPNDLHGTFDSSSAYNLIGFDSNLSNNIDDDPDGTGNHNQVGGEDGQLSSAIDPNLAQLGDYGGPTRTHALLPGSPAIDKGSSTAAATAGLTTDQRGFDREVDDVNTADGADGFVDIGAYEAIPPIVDLNGPAEGEDYAVTFTEGDPGTPIVDDEHATILDLDSGDLAQLTIAITNIQNPGEESVSVDTTVAAANGIAVDDSVAGQVTLTRTSAPYSTDAFVNVLRTATYSNSSDAPDTEARVIEFIANDGRYDGNVAVSTVTVVPVNDAPTAVAGGPYAVQLNDAIVLDASGSTDPDNDALAYGWDLNGDQVYSDVTGMQPSIAWNTLYSFRINSVGTYTIGLQVKDGEDVVATDTATITVYDVFATDVLKWDPDRTTDGHWGGSGSWTDPDVWFDVTTQSRCTWSSSFEGSSVLFVGEAGTVTVSGAVSTVGIEFDTSGYTVSGGVVMLASNSAYPAVIDVETGVANITSVVAGSVGLEKTGAGTLILAGAGTYCGGTDITEGTLQIGEGGTTGSIGFGEIDINWDTALVIDRSGELTINNEIQGDGALGKDGAGKLTLSGVNQFYGGDITVNDGELELGCDRYCVYLGLGYGVCDLTVGANATVDLHGHTAYVGALSGAAGAVITNDDSNSPAELHVNGTGTYLGTIDDGSGNISLYVSGGYMSSGELTLSGANTYTGGTTVYGGTLVLAHSNGDTLATVGDITIAGGTLDLGWNTQTVSGAVSFHGGTVQNGMILKSGDDYDGWAGTVTATLVGDIGLTKFGTGTLSLRGANTKQYQGETTVNDGVLDIRDGLDLTYTGKITVIDDAILQFTGDQSLTGTGEVFLQQEDVYESSHWGGILVDGSATLTVGANVLIHGCGLISETSPGNNLDNWGTIQADVADAGLHLDIPWTNRGTFAAIGDAILTKNGAPDRDHLVWNGYLRGSSSAPSGTELTAAVSWDGFTGSQWTFSVEVSLNGEDYYTVATHQGSDGDADAPSTFLLSGLDPGESYYLKVVARDGTATEIYDARPTPVTTLDVSDHNVPDDSSGWYRVGAITSDGSNELESPHGPPPVGHPGSLDEPELSFGAVLTPAASGDWAPYVDLDLADDDPDKPTWLADATVDVTGATGSPPIGSDHVFSLDTSWIYAGSPEGAVLQAVQGLVTDGSTPSMVDGSIKLWHVRHYVLSYYQGSPQWLCEDDFYTFDRGQPPTGGYSELWRYEGYDIDTGNDPPPCDCGCDGSSGGSGTSTNTVTTTGGCSACGTALGGLTYSSRAMGDSGFGPGWSDADEFPTLLGGSQNFAVRFGTEASTWFNEDGGDYTARYGAQETLVHDVASGLYVFTRTDGTQYKFYDAATAYHPEYGLYCVVAPSGATIEVTEWTTLAADGIDDRIKSAVYKMTEGGDPYQRRVFEYWRNDGDVGRRGHVHTITLSEPDGISWADIRQVTYDYYGDSDPHGTAGDLKSVLTRQWDGSAWTGDDTYYYRYYAGEYDSVENPGHADDLMRVLLPNAYAVAETFAQGLSTTVDQLTDEQIADFTCFYYEYDADHRVSKEVVFGASNESDITNTLSTNADGYNSWYRKSYEERPDGTTNTVYTNYIGQTLLTDLYDPASQTHTLTYNRYGTEDDGIDGNDGQIILSVDSAAFQLSGGKYYDDALPDLVAYASNSPYLSDSDGLFQVITYYASTSGGIGEDTAGGVEGYLFQMAVAHGEAAAQLTVSSPGGPILLSSYTYYARTVGDATIYPVASYTTYANEDGTGASITECAYNGWYSDSFQYQELIATLPTVGTAQNGSGDPVTTKQWFDAAGNLTWSMNERDRVTYYEYDSLTGQLTRTIEDIDDDTADGLSLMIPGGWSLPTSDGANAATEYEHDALGRITQTLGPIHTADIDGTPTSVRTATWTFYDDANHETRSAQGYATETSPGVWTTFAIVGPISITITDRDGRTTQQIEATYSGPVSGLATAVISQSCYTAWTTYQYSKTRLVSMRVYDDISTTDGDPGTAGVNYEQTSYGYENYGQPGVLMGRQNKVVTPDGTITRYVLDARGNILETWKGTNDTGATDADPSAGGTNGMVKMASYTYDADGNRLTSTDALSRTTGYAYDWRGRMIQETDPDPDGEGELTSSVTEYAYDNRSLMIGQTDPLGNVTSYAYDSLGQQYRVTEPDPDGEGGVDSSVTNYYFDAAGNLASLVDSLGNTTSWVYDGLNRAIEETNQLSDTRYFEYDVAGNLTQTTDRDGRVTEYVYDSVGRVLEENWLDGQSVVWTIAYAYDSAGRLESVGDDAAEYEYSYDDAGRVLTETQAIAGLTPTVVLSYQYDTGGNRTQVASTVGGTADFVTDYSYDYLGNVERIEQYGATGGNAVAPKRVDFTYDAASQWDTITRYANLAGTHLVATGTYGYDLAGRLSSLGYTKGQTTLVDYGWSYDAAGRMTQYVNSIDGTVDYTNDNTGQLTGADYDYQTDETYTYDENGNRTGGREYDPYVTGPCNRLVRSPDGDDYISYQYDDEGNLIVRYFADNDSTVEYAYDHRNRLTDVTEYGDSFGPVVKRVHYEYDAFNQVIERVVDPDGDTGSAAVDQTFYLYDQGQIVLEFHKTGSGDATAGNLSHRYLWGNTVDQLLADEQVDGLQVAGDVLWPLVDRLNTVRDLATYDSQSDETTIANHRVFEAYGTLSSETNAAVDCLFGFTGRMYDEDTGLQNNLNRWYDPTVGRWMSEDPIGFAAGDVNLYRYCGNAPTNATDPTGSVVRDVGWDWPSWHDYWHYLWHPGDEDRDIQVGQAVAVGVGIGAGVAAGGCAIVGVDPWLGAAGLHGAHHGLGTHAELILRVGPDKVLKVIIPGKDAWIWWGIK